MRFGRLVVIGFDRIAVSTSGKSKWLKYWCRCDCGTVKSIHAGALKAKRGATVSCGCFQKEDVSIRSSNAALGTPEERTLRRVQSQYKSRAKHEGREFAIEFDAFLRLVRADCEYCGTAPRNRHVFNGYSSAVKAGFVVEYNGIDRIDSSRGYVPDNVVTCCKVCNIAKRDMTADEFADWVDRIAAHKAKTHWDSVRAEMAEAA